MAILVVLDPNGIRERARHKLRRRQYLSKGPNYIWHIDDYDTLKAFGFCIHGAIDGYSRRILWLEVGSSNNDPSIMIVSNNWEGPLTYVVPMRVLRMFMLRQWRGS